MLAITGPAYFWVWSRHGNAGDHWSWLLLGLVQTR